MTAPQQLLGPDGKTPLRRYAGYNGGGPGFGGQLIDWNAPQQLSLIHISEPTRH